MTVFPPPKTSRGLKAAVLVHYGKFDMRLAATWPDYDRGAKPDRPQRTID